MEEMNAEEYNNYMKDEDIDSITDKDMDDLEKQIGAMKRRSAWLERQAAEKQRKRRDGWLDKVFAEKKNDAQKASEDLQKAMQGLLPSSPSVPASRTPSVPAGGSLRVPRGETPSPELKPSLLERKLSPPPELIPCMPEGEPPPPPERTPSPKLKPVLPEKELSPPRARTPLPSGVSLFAPRGMPTSPTRTSPTTRASPTTRTEEQRAADLAKLDAQADLQIILKKTRERLSDLPYPEPKRRRYGVLTEDMISFALAPTEDGGLSYKEKQKREKTPYWDSEDERNLEKVKEYLAESPVVGSSASSVQGLQSPWDHDPEMKGTPKANEMVIDFEEVALLLGDIPQGGSKSTGTPTAEDGVIGTNPSREDDTMGGLGLGVSSPIPSTAEYEATGTNLSQEDDAMECLEGLGLGLSPPAPSAREDDAIGSLQGLGLGLSSSAPPAQEAEAIECLQGLGLGLSSSAPPAQVEQSEQVLGSMDVSTPAADSGSHHDDSMDVDDVVAGDDTAGQEQEDTSTDQMEGVEEEKTEPSR